MTISAVVPSPIGPLRLTADGDELVGLQFMDHSPSVDPIDSDVLDEAARQLRAYFDGRRRDFELPIALRGSAFQVRVWEELRRIPYGATASYADIAARLGMSIRASRAIGLANGSNPIAIVVPCHRVIGADGSLVGFGGGLARKRFLLDLEAPSIQDPLFPE